MNKLKAQFHDYQTTGHNLIARWNIAHDMWSAGNFAAGEILHRGRGIAQRHRRRIISSDADTSASALGANGLRSLVLPPHSSCSSEDISAVISFNNHSNICAAASAAAAAAAHSTAWPIQHSTLLAPTAQGTRAAVRVRSLAAAFESSQASSDSGILPVSPAALSLLKPADESESEADAAVLIAARCVKQLTAEWESYSSAGGSVASSTCSSPTHSFTSQHYNKPFSRPVTPAVAVAAAAASQSSDSAAEATAVKLAADPAVAALLRFRQDSGQLEPFVELLKAAAAAAGGAGAGAGAATTSHLLQADCAAAAAAAVLSPELASSSTAAAGETGFIPGTSSVLCTAAVWATLVSAKGGTDCGLLAAPCVNSSYA